jgi:two-component system phosphate regulon sensor histidine kinase PhoR
LTVLAGFVETMTDLPLDDQERRRILELMGQQTQRMQALVSDLLNLAQLEGSPRPPVDQWHVLSSVLNSAHADAVALSAKRHLIELGSPPQCLVSGDLKELHSALLNLLSNAVRYTPEGGTIRISSLVREDGCALLEVIDNGPGIAREHLPRLTERFYRTDVGRSRASGGTGLGLAIVKHVMQRHGGSVEIESQEGVGSTFRLVLPAYRVQYGTEQQESS